MTGRARVLDQFPQLAELATAQGSAVSRRQLASLGITAQHVQTQLEAHRWQEVGGVVVVLHTGPLEVQTLQWAAVLNGGDDAAVCAWTALSLWGLTGWERDAVHVVVRRGADPCRLAGVSVHESRRHTADDVRRRHGLPLHSVERAAIDAGAWSTKPRTACGILAAVVQQGLSTPDRLLAQADTVGKVRHLSIMRYALQDIGGGARAMSEIDMARLCRRAGLPEPRRQVRRRDPAGRWRYLDVLWELPNGRRVMLEIDGVGHLEVERWYDDLLRAAEVSCPGETVLRLPSAAARLEPDRVVAILRRYLLA